MDYLRPPVPAQFRFIHDPPLLLSPSNRSTRGGLGWGAVVFQRRCTGQPLFIRMNQRGDKISPVTRRRYEIKVLIEFSRAGRGCGVLNIIEFDRIMKRAPVLVRPPSARHTEEAERSGLVHTHARARALHSNIHKLVAVDHNALPHREPVDFSKHTPNASYNCALWAVELLSIRVLRNAR